ncbi:uncharacterized protein [Drosophila takahashii]|uniref:uncharacterized protein n=1 Tax=Drosophila takahashii TaxID=29030 RepID=UPI001CF896EC|nr:uncharacterized protein LOC108066519 [Drosophila takahashii]
MVVPAVCCRCGSDSEPYALPFCVGGASYEFHCFCCAKTPPRQCIHCNAPGDLKGLRNLNEKHAKCCKGEDNLHVFVFTQPWPPFPEKISESEQEEHCARTTPVKRKAREPLQVTEMEVLIPNPGTFADEEEPPLPPEIEPHMPNPMTLDKVEQESQEPPPQPEAALELVISSPRTLSVSDFDVQETITAVAVTEEKDIKPSEKEEQMWYTPSEILRWQQCPRCEKVRVTNRGWITHAQKCGQNLKYNKPTFHIYCHTKGWCDYLIRDSLWEQHSDPNSGTCDVCSAMRRERRPVPFMPKAPDRVNEDYMAKKRRQNFRLNTKRMALLSKRNPPRQVRAPPISLE